MRTAQDIIRELFQSTDPKTTKALYAELRKIALGGKAPAERSEKRPRASAEPR